MMFQASRRDTEHPPGAPVRLLDFDTMSDSIRWMSTKDASERLGVTLRTLYRFIDEGRLPAYQVGRVIRLKAEELEAFIDSLRITPGTLSHLYPDSRSDASLSEATGT
jgi:excisionase family DNA binding protein